jgi:hypothetical protein
MTHGGGDVDNRVGGSLSVTRREFCGFAGLAGAAVGLPSSRALASEHPIQVGAPQDVGPVMERLSSYMSEAAGRALPDEVAR